jgi:hypothetical protein
MGDLVAEVSRRLRRLMVSAIEDHTPLLCANKECLLSKGEDSKAEETNGLDSEGDSVSLVVSSRQ